MEIIIMKEAVLTSLQPYGTVNRSECFDAVPGRNHWSITVIIGRKNSSIKPKSLPTYRFTVQQRTASFLLNFFMEAYSQRGNHQDCLRIFSTVEKNWKFDWFQKRRMSVQQAYIQ